MNPREYRPRPLPPPGTLMVRKVGLGLAASPRLQPSTSARPPEAAGSRP
jgi:hypothetical protein